MSKQPIYLTFDEAAAYMGQLVGRQYTAQGFKNHIYRGGLRPSNKLAQETGRLIFTQAEVEEYVENNPDNFRSGPTGRELTTSRLWANPDLMLDMQAGEVVITRGGKRIKSIEPDKPRYYKVTYADGSTESLWNSCQLETIEEVNGE